MTVIAIAAKRPASNPAEKALVLLIACRSYKLRGKEHRLFQSLRPMEFHSADSKTPEKMSVGRTGYKAVFRANAIRSNVAAMRAPATNVPGNVPETFDSPPARRR